MNVFELFAKISLDDGEYKNKLKSAGQNIQELSTKIGNGLKTVAKIGAAAVAAGAAGIAALGKMSIEGYAEYEQLAGGVETLFKDSANIVKEYAENAYKTAGLSANNYMNTVTSFSASLISSLGGDTAKAAEYANRAIVDMSDNANKMGTDISMIQNAYQGFAKGNYTMLDNLKLGYGGTQEEMKRLIKEAANMTDAQKALGVTVDANSMSFANIVDAISVVQYSMGISGATAQEAEHTISGSINAMKAAWQNLVVAFSDPNADLGQYVDRFVESVIVAKDNIVPTIRRMLPRIVEGLGQLIDELGPLVRELLGEMLPHLIQGAAKLVADLIVRLPGLLKDFAVALKDALIQSLNEAGLEEVGRAIESVFNWFTENKGIIIDALMAIGGAIAAVFVVGTVLNFVSAISSLMNPLALLVAVIGALVPLVIKYWDEISAFFQSIGQAISEMVTNVGIWFDQMKANVQEAWSNMLSTISEKWESIKSKTAESWENIKSTVSQRIENVKTAISNGLNNAKSTATSILTNISNAFKEKMEAAKNGVKNAIDKIKSFFNFSWSLPHIKLPHFSISGSFSLNPPSVPRFSISWYRKAMNNAMLLDGATIFGAMNGKFLGGGEAGREVVAGADTLMNMIQDSIRKVDRTDNNTGHKNISPIFNITVNGSKYDDLNKLAKDLMYEMQNEYQNWELAHA